MFIFRQPKSLRFYDVEVSDIALFLTFQVFLSEAGPAICRWPPGSSRLAPRDLFDRASHLSCSGAGVGVGMFGWVLAFGFVDSWFLGRLSSFLVVVSWF